jgi:ribosome recycling factor
MIPELKKYYDEAHKEMDDAYQYLKRELSHIRAGKATPTLLDGIKVDYYGTQTPLNQLAGVTAPEARLLVIQPYDKGAIEAIEKAIMTSGLGLNPNNDGTLIRIPLPILSEERRKELVKLTHEIAENARISIRNGRRDANDKIKHAVKEESLPEDSKFDAESEVQKLTDQYIEKVEDALKKKEHEILTV